MKKLIFILLILFLTIGAVSAGNNTTEITNPTTFHSGLDTVTALESGDSNISFSDGYKGYCVEWGEHSAEINDIYYIENTDKAINNNNNKNVGNELKIMFLFFPEKVNEDIVQTQHMIWAFTDKNFSRVDYDWYNEIVSLSDKYKIPDEGTIKINETHEFCFSFRVFVSQINEYQNYFGYKFYIDKIKYNDSIQINNSTINNNTTLSPNILFNETESQFNKINITEKEKRMSQPTLTHKNILKKHITGIDTKWVFGWIIILLIMAMLFYRKED